MDIETCVQSPMFKSPLRAIFQKETYEEGLNHLCFHCEHAPISAPHPTLLDRVKHIAFGLLLLIPIINAIALFILKKYFNGTFYATFAPLGHKISSSFTGVKTDYLLPALAGLVAVGTFFRHGKYKLSLAILMNSILHAIHATMGLFLPREVKLLNNINKT